MSSQRGNALALVTVSLTVLMGASALAIDVGLNTSKRTHMQAAADSAALAGAQSLLISEGTARTLAKEIAGQHGFTLADSDILFPTADSLKVQWTSPVAGHFAAVLGIPQFQVPVSATAQVKPMTEGSNLRPWGIPLEDFQGYELGTSYTIKLSALSDRFQGSGNFYALGLDGVGARTYEETIVQGSQEVYAIGDLATTETGNMVGPTTQGLEALVGSDPHLTYASALKAGQLNSSRVVTVALIDSGVVVKGRKDVEIVGFASFFVTHWTDNAAISGQFIRHATPNGRSDGTSSVLNGTQAVALID